MSADNQYTVSRLHENTEEVRYGIFHEFSSHDYPADYFTTENAVCVFADPVAAITHAHKMQRDNPTEYGVYVNSLVLKDIE